MAHEAQAIQGTPYQAQFMPGEDANVGYSAALVMIEPPVGTGDKNNIALNCIFNQYPNVEIVFNHLVTTASKTLIELEIHDSDDVPGIDNESNTHDERIEIARESVMQYIGFINRVESGVFDGSTYNILRERGE